MPSSSKTAKKAKEAVGGLTAVVAEVVTPVVETTTPTKRTRATTGKKKTEQPAAAADTVVAEPVVVEEKPVKVEAAEAVAVATAATAAPAAPAATKKKGGSSKKPVKVVAVVTPDGIEGSFTPEPRRPLIAHLPIKTSEVIFHDQPLRYDPTPPSLADPEPYDALQSNMFADCQETIPQIEQLNSDTNTVKDGVTGCINDGEQRVNAAAGAETASAQVVTAAAVAEARSMPCFTKADLMVQFRGASEQKLLPTTTDVACFWCAHAFEWTPCVIPEREVAGVYNVYGNFCCPECATAYLLSESMDPHVRWERMALLQRIYDFTGKGRIFPAPARESLKLFGGPMSIETFRATMREGKVRVDVHMPPMVSILGSIDTKPIDFFDLTMKNGSGGPVLPQRSVEEGLRLKRTKPLKDRESTLDTVMNIRIGFGASAAAGRR